MLYYWDPTYILVIAGLVVCLFAQAKVSSAYAKWRQVPSRTGLTGAQVARRILDGNGCQDVRIEAISGSLTDHYDPQNGVLRLSSEVYQSGSIAALGVAAHEAGHAIQDAQDYAPMRIRANLVLVANIGSHAAVPLFMLGLIMSGSRCEDRHLLLAGRAVLRGDAAGRVQRVGPGCGAACLRLSAGG